MKSASRRSLRRATSILAIVALALAVGCSGGGGSTDGAEVPAVEETATGSQAETGAGQAEINADLIREIKVGLVTDERGLDDQGFNALANKGLQEAIAGFDIEGRVFESSSADDYVPNLSQFAEAGYDLVISVGPGMADATREVAESYEGTHFAIIDFGFPEGERLQNVQGLAFDEAEAGYLAGYLAALATRTGTIATVGARPAEEVGGYLNGFIQGAKAARSEIELLEVGLDAGDASQCDDLTLAAIAKGADVIFPASSQCASRALPVVRENGVWGIGVDVDQSFLGDHILTSALKRVDVAVLDTIQAATQGVVEDALGTMSPYRLKGGDTVVYGMNYGGIGLGRVSPAVPPDLLAKVDDVAERIVEGTLHVPSQS